jgi:diguanylate cyclase (GGDEF)-like protein
MAGERSRGRNREVTTTMVVGGGARATTRDRGVLTIIAGPQAGRVVPIPDEGLKLGRSDECTLVFDDSSLSRVHAVAARVGRSFVLRDNGSTNGSFVNGKRTEGAVEMQDGDRIELGTSTVLRFSLVDEAEEKTLVAVFEAGRTDALTGIANRKAFDERFDSELASAIRHGDPMSLALMDVDFFKKVNDAHGHPGGDAVLKAVAATLARAVRTEDMLARYGGEEFALVVRMTDVFEASMMVDRLRMSVAAAAIEHEGKRIAVTMSAGVASIACCGPAPDRAKLVALADARLYQAKQNGRNRVVGGG